MRLVDTVVLVSSNDKTHRLYPRAIQHLSSLVDSNDVYIPSSTLIEYDLELKTHGFSAFDRQRILDDIGIVIPDNKILPCTPLILAVAIQFESYGGFFDSLLAATAIMHGAVVISTDPVFDHLGIPRVW